MGGSLEIESEVLFLAGRAEIRRGVCMEIREEVRAPLEGLQVLCVKFLEFLLELLYADRKAMVLDL